MKSNSALKKHHFWLLLGFVPLLTLIGAMMVSSSVGSAIEGRQKILDDSKKTLNGKTTPKPTALIDAAKNLLVVVNAKQVPLHEGNWGPQKDLYKWPAGSPTLLKKYDALNLKFGDPLPNTEGQFDEFKKSEVYIHQFSSITKANPAGPGTGMADRIAPTQFNGGWQKVLRHVEDFGQNQLTKDQVWLMMEDIWIQRSLLESLRTINEDSAVFRRAKLDKDGNVVIDPSYDEMGNKLQLDAKGQPVVVIDPSTKKPVIDPVTRAKKFVTIPTPEEEKRKGLFRNRIWSIELELVSENNGQRVRLTGTLANQSDRLQLMGVGNIMTLNVWFKGQSEPMPFKIGGEYVAGKGATKQVFEPVLGPDGKPQKDRDGKDKVVEKTELANVLPVIPTDDHLLPPGTDLNKELARVEQAFDIRTVPIKRIDALALGFLDSRNAGKPLLEWGNPNPAAAAPAATTTPAAPAATGSEPGGIAAAPVGGNTRSAPKTRQVGGGPIAAVIDGNKKRYLEVSPFIRRMPVGIVLIIDQTQIQDVLMVLANSPLRWQTTQVVWTRFRGSLTSSSGANPALNDSGVEVGSGKINIAGPGDPDSRPPVARPLPGTFPPGLRPGGNPFGKSSSTVSESQVTSGLVELSVYGIVSLYERPESPKPEAPKTDGTVATPKDPMPKDMPPKDPMPKDPMPSAPKKPNMRRRVRG